MSDEVSGEREWERPTFTVVERDGVRVVTYVSTAEDGTVTQLERTHLVGVAHWYKPGGLNDPIVLYAGPFTLGGAELVGVVTQTWTPLPKIRVAGDRVVEQSVEQLRALLEPSADVWVVPEEFALPDAATIPAQPVGSAGRDDGGDGGVYSVVSTTNVVRLGATGGFECVTFLVPNGWSAWDGFEVGDPDDPTVSVAGGVVARGGGWEVFVHPRFGGAESRVKALAERGGHDVTHVGRLRRVDGGTFDDAQAVDVLRTVRLCVSLACGRTTTALHPVAWAGGVPVAARWTGAPVDGARDVAGWLDPTVASAQVTELLQRALSFCVDAAGQQLMRHAVSFLVTANFDVDVEMAVAVSVSALHMLSFARLVTDKQVMTAKEHKKARTEVVIRAFLADCSIDTNVPAHFAELGKVAAELKKQINNGSSPDGLETLVWMRNGIIHPTKDLPDRWSIYQWAEASIMARHLLTLAVLNLVGYVGKYRSPLSTNRWVGVVEDVPWGP